MIGSVFFFSYLLPPSGSHCRQAPAGTNFLSSSFVASSWIQLNLTDARRYFVVQCRQLTGGGSGVTNTRHGESVVFLMMVSAKKRYVRSEDPWACLADELHVTQTVGASIVGWLRMFSSPTRKFMRVRHRASRAPSLLFCQYFPEHRSRPPKSINFTGSSLLFLVVAYIVCCPQMGAPLPVEPSIQAVQPWPPRWLYPRSVSRSSR